MESVILLFLESPTPKRTFMPTFSQSAPIQQFIHSLPSSGAPFFYLVLGKEEANRQTTCEQIIHQILPSQKERELSLSVFQGGKGDPHALLDLLYSPSFFVKTRVILVEQAEKLDKSIHSSIEKFFTQPFSKCYLIFSASGWTKTQSFYKSIGATQVILDLPELKSWEKEKESIEWVRRQVSIAGKIIGFDVCTAFVKFIGTDQHQLEQELKKLLCFCSDVKEITTKDLHAICSRGAASSVWQLGEAIFQRNGALALQLGQAILNEGEPFFVLLRQIRSQLQTDYEVALLLKEGKGGTEVAQIFPFMKGQLLDRHLKQAKAYGVESFRRGILAVDAIELRSKNGDFDEKILLELLIMQLTLKKY